MLGIDAHLHVEFILRIVQPGAPFRLEDAGASDPDLRY